MLRWDDKDPDEILDYALDWRQRRLDDGDSVASSAWTVPAGLTKTDESFSADKTVVWLTGGTVGETYVIVNRITTAAGRTMDQSVKLRIANK